MRSEHAGRSPTLVAIAVAMLACHSRDADVGCSPTLTCSLRESRFAPPEPKDAGPPRCGEDEHRCRADKLAAGGAHACAIAPAGELLCWGSDAEGQLGGGSSRDAGSGDAGIIPVLERVQDVAAGGAHSCALADDRSVHCWGLDAEGQVDGQASPEPVTTPWALSIDGATDVAAGGAHSCAVVPEGVVCWGSARFGQAGREIGERVLEPDLVAGTEGAVEVAAGLRHSCARLQSGSVVCWGELLEPASGEARASADALAVRGLDDATGIAAGAGFSCALRAGGHVVCWGQNESGQLGDGTTQASASPVEVVDLELSLQVSAGGGERDGILVGHACALTRTFHVECWGRNQEGQLGVGRAADSPRPLVVLGEEGEEEDEALLPDVTTIAVGGFFSCAIDHDGPVRCWGDDALGQLGTRRPGTTSFGRIAQVYLFRD